MDECVEQGADRVEVYAQSEGEVRFAARGHYAVQDVDCVWGVGDEVLACGLGGEVGGDAFYGCVCCCFGRCGLVDVGED